MFKVNEKDSQGWHCPSTLAFQVNNKSNRLGFKICSKLTRHQNNAGGLYFYIETYFTYGPSTSHADFEHVLLCREQ